MQRRLLAVPQAGELRDICRGGVRGGDRVYHAATVGTDVQLHPEVPLISLPRLAHLGVARLRRFLHRIGRAADRGIDDDTRLQQELPLLEQMQELADRDLVGHGVVQQIDASEAPHPLRVVQHVVRLQVREMEPLLEEVDPEHRRHRQWAPAAPRLREYGATSASTVANGIT